MMTEILIHPSNFNIDTGFTQSQNRATKILQQAGTASSNVRMDNSSRQTSMSRLCYTDCVMTDRLTPLSVPTGLLLDKETGVQNTVGTNSMGSHVTVTSTLMMEA